MSDDETVQPVSLPIDPENPPEFPGKLPRELSRELCDRLQAIAEEISPYLGPEHRAIKALNDASHELMITVPFRPRYAEYTPEE